MSRHRDVRNLDYDEMLDDEAAADEMTPAEVELLDRAIEEITNRLGQGFSIREVRDTAWYYYFDVDKSTNYLLEQHAKKIDKQKTTDSGSGVAHKGESTSKGVSEVSPGVSSHEPENESGAATAKSSQPITSQFSKPSPDDIVSKAQATSKGTIREVAVDTSTESDSQSITKVANKCRLGRPADYTDKKISLVVVGHVDAGKSTLFGRLLYDIGELDERTMQKLKKESEKVQKSSFAFAWAMDSGTEERERGITIDIATSSFRSGEKDFTILDAPGHRDYVPNMIAGASLADFAVLVVDASRGAFESGFEGTGQTKEHAVLLRSLGLQRVIIAINKLDNMDWSQERFNDVAIQMTTYMLQIGYEKPALRFIPCSGLTGENVVNPIKAPSGAWYRGASLLQEMVEISPQSKDDKAPFRMMISDIQTTPNSSNITVTGKIATGELQRDDSVLCFPSKESATVKSIVSTDQCAVAFAGDSVTLVLSGIEAMYLRAGDVICHSTDAIQNHTSLEARVVVFAALRPLLTGSSIVLHRGRADLPAVIREIRIPHKAKPGGYKRARHVIGGTQAIVTVQIERGLLPLETFADNKDLGRIILRREGQTVAAGIVTRLLS